MIVLLTVRSSAAASPIVVSPEIVTVTADKLPTDVMSLPCESKLPPSWGVVSSTTFAIALDVARPCTIVLRVTFFKPPPEVSIAKNTSSLAIEDSSDRLPIVVGLKLVPSATNNASAVLVPIVISSPETVKSTNVGLSVVARP